MANCVLFRLEKLLELCLKSNKVLPPVDISRKELPNIKFIHLHDALNYKWAEVATGPKFI